MEAPSNGRVQAMGLAFAGLTVALWSALFFRLPEIRLGDDGVGGRLAFALSCGAIAILLTLCLGVQSIAMERALDPNAANPLQANESPILKVNARFLQNTLEQSLPFLLGLAGLAAALATPAALRAVTASTVTWVVLRWSFWAGYHVHPMYRAGGQFSLVQSHLILCFVAYQLGAQRWSVAVGAALVGAFVAGNAVLGLLIIRSVRRRRAARA